MNIVVCVDEEGKFVPVSKLSIRPKTLNFVCGILRECVVVCDSQDEKFVKLVPCAKMIVKDNSCKQKLPDFLTRQNEFVKNETVASCEEIRKIVCRLNGDRVFALGALAEEILNNSASPLKANKVILVSLSTAQHVPCLQNILPKGFKKVKSFEPIIDGICVDFATEYVAAT